MATHKNYIDLVNLILDHKPNVNALDKDGGTALTIACKEGYSEISASLLRAGAYVNIQVRKYLFCYFLIIFHFMIRIEMGIRI